MRVRRRQMSPHSMAQKKSQKTLVLLQSTRECYKRKKPFRKNMLVQEEGEKN